MRKGPPFHAKDCKGLTRRGNDGKEYISISDKKGTYKWVPKVNNTNKSMKSYLILDNGSEPFRVEVLPDNVIIYRRKIVKGTNTYIDDKDIFQTTYENIFIGDNLLKDPKVVAKGKLPGNSILIHVKSNTYIFIGSEIYSFNSFDNIKKYYSPVGPNYVPYPYAVGEKYTYFMLEKTYVPNELLDLTQDAYGQLYGFTVKDNELKNKIKESAKEFKVKLIHKRWIY